MKTIHIVLTAAVVAFTSCQKEVLPMLDESYHPDVSPGNFLTSMEVTNPYFRFEDGKTYVYEGQTENGLEHIEVNLLPTTKEVMGIKCIVVNDKVWYNDKLVRDAQSWYAQDNDGNVFYFGEMVSNYRVDGSLKDHSGSWEAGTDRAQPGVVMLANPEIGKMYRVKYYLNIAEDKASIAELSVTVTVPFDSYIGCLKTKNWTDLQPGVIKDRFYAPGVGLVSEINQTTKTEIALVDIR